MTLALRNNGTSLAQNGAGGWTRDQIELLKTQVCPGATDQELALFGQVCRGLELDPFLRQIYAIKRRAKNDRGGYDEKMSIQIGIDGQRLMAERTGKFGGTLRIEWTADGRNWVDCWLESYPPRAARATVARIDGHGQVTEITAVAKWDSFAQSYYNKEKRAKVPTGLWAQMPEHMLGKCAEMQALRRAFGALFREAEAAGVSFSAADDAREASYEGELLEEETGSSPGGLECEADFEGPAQDDPLYVDMTPEAQDNARRWFWGQASKAWPSVTGAELEAAVYEEMAREKLLAWDEGKGRVSLSASTRGQIAAAGKYLEKLEVPF